MKCLSKSCTTDKEKNSEQETELKHNKRNEEAFTQLAGTKEILEMYLSGKR